MHRFYVPETGVGEVVTLPKDEAQHAARVLRLRAGAAVQLLDGKALYDAELETVSDDAVTAKVLCERPSPEPPARVTLWQGLPKADKLELIAQKGTELGMAAMWSVEMTRSVARLDKPQQAAKKTERLRRIALEAAKQSGRACVPVIEDGMRFKDALKRAADGAFDAIYVAWEEEHALPLSRAVMADPPKNALIIIGPEGGITPEEWEALHALGAISVTLGPRILRTETAGLCALSVLWASLGEM